jgi:adenylate cyclase
MAIEHYEVYYFQNGRWHVHARFEAAERETAIEEAKSVETNLGYAARVIRETFYPESNTTEEVVTFQGNRAKKISDSDSMFGAGAASAGPGARVSGGSTSGGPTRSSPKQSSTDSSGSTRQQVIRKEEQKQKQKTRKKAKNALLMVLTGFMLSLFIAVIGSLAITLVLFQMVEAGLVPKGNRNSLVFGTFILLFLGSAFLYLNKRFNIVRLFKKKPDAKRGPAPKTIPKLNTQKHQTATRAPDLADADLDELAKRVKQEDGGKSQKELSATSDEDGFESAAATEKESKKEEKNNDKDDKKDKAAKKKEEEQKKKEAEKKAKQDEEKRKAAEKKKKEKSPADVIKPEFLKFLTDAVTSIQKEHPQLNTFSKFGMNLYLCGACSTICQAKGLPSEVMVSLLKDGLTLIGTNAARAQSFCDDISTYGSNPRYAGMVQAGGQAMANFIGGQSNTNAGLSGLLTEWNLPEKRSSIPTMFTFLFTDIVGFTAMTQRLGNAGAQKAVRAHNDAVRGAIQQFNGREVKHTGDGIMATFPDGPSAVAASIQMLQGIVAHNQASPDVPVQIRIGVNTGEAVEEENDFFGQAVQMTARICDKAADGHAWVSEVVVQACQGQRFGFLPRGEFEMKGIERPKPLFEIAWTDAHRDELADL